MTVPGLMTEKMTVTLMTRWRLEARWQCGAIYEVSNDPSFFWGHWLSFQPRVEFKAAISDDSVSLSSVVIQCNGSCHPSHVVDDADVDNQWSWSDESKETIEPTKPITVIWCLKDLVKNLILVFMMSCSVVNIFELAVYCRWLCDNWSKEPEVESVQAVSAPWSQLY